MRQYSLPRRSRGILAAALLGSALLSLPSLEAQAAPVADAVNDFIPTFTGVHNGDLDVLSLSAVFDGAFHLTAVMNGKIGTTDPTYSRLELIAAPVQQVSRQSGKPA